MEGEIERMAFYLPPEQTGKYSDVLAFGLPSGHLWARRNTPGLLFQFLQVCKSPNVGWCGERRAPHRGNA